MLTKKSVFFKNDKSNNRSRGFTLIELLVVISIISLLSSIVLASVRTATENAKITKTVSELKSLQNAVEMYRNKYGRYPSNNPSLQIQDSSLIDASQNSFTSEYAPSGNPVSEGGGIYDFWDSFLRQDKFMNTPLKAPNDPNNCNTFNACHSASSYYIGYISNPDRTYYRCGVNVPNNYIIYFYANSKKVNLQLLKFLESTDSYSDVLEDANKKIYCISG